MFNTILAGPSDPIEKANAHPQLAIKSRSQTLQNLQNKVSYEMTFLENKKSTGYFDILVNEYKKAHKDYKIKQMQDEMQLNSDTYQTVFKAPKAKEEIEREINNKKREEYYKNFVLAAQESAKKKKKKGQYNDDDDYEIAISGVNITKPLQTQSEVNLQNLQVEKMNQLDKQLNLYRDEFENLMTRTDEAKFKIGNAYICKNDKLIDTLTPHLMNCFNVYSEEIAEGILDEILYEQVEFLNGLEKFKQGIDDIRNQTTEVHEDLRYERDPQANIPSNVMRLLKTLDDFAD